MLEWLKYYVGGQASHNISSTTSSSDASTGRRVNQVEMTSFVRGTGDVVRREQNPHHTLHPQPSSSSSSFSLSSSSSSPSLQAPHAMTREILPPSPAPSEGSSWSLSGSWHRFRESTRTQAWLCGLSIGLPVLAGATAIAAYFANKFAPGPSPSCDHFYRGWFFVWPIYSPGVREAFGDVHSSQDDYANSEAGMDALKELIGCRLHEVGYEEAGQWASMSVVNFCHEALKAIWTDGCGDVIAKNSTAGTEYFCRGGYPGDYRCPRDVLGYSDPFNALMWLAIGLGVVSVGVWGLGLATACSGKKKSNAANGEA